MFMEIRPNKLADIPNCVLSCPRNSRSGSYKAHLKYGSSVITPHVHPHLILVNLSYKISAVYSKHGAIDII